MKNILWNNVLLHIASILIICAAMFYIAEVDIVFYRIVMMGIAGWQIGSWVGSVTHKRWPTSRTEN